MQDHYQFETPENVSFDYEVSGIGSRFVAALVDHVLIGFVWLIVVVVALAIARSTTGDPNILVAAITSLMLLLVGYYILFELAWNGQTPGKRWVGLRVLRADGTAITTTDVLVRNIVRLADFLPVYYALGLVSMFFSKDARRLGDYAAGTVVVKDRKEVSLESLQTAPPLTLRDLGPRSPAPLSPVAPAAPPQGLAVMLPVGRLTAADHELVADFLRRRYQLADSAELSRRIATAIALKLDLDQTDFTPLGAVVFLEQVEAAYRRMNV